MPLKPFGFLACGLMKTNTTIRNIRSKCVGMLTQCSSHFNLFWVGYNPWTPLPILPTKGQRVRLLQFDWQYLLLKVKEGLANSCCSWIRTSPYQECPDGVLIVNLKFRPLTSDFISLHGGTTTLFLCGAESIFSHQGCPCYFFNLTRN